MPVRAAEWNPPMTMPRFRCRQTQSHALKPMAWVLIALLIVGVWGSRQPALAAEPPSTMIIFDGSGSMWGKLDGDKRSKFDIAREALKPALAKVSATANYGLMSFGHRRSGDCTDVQVMAAIAPGDPSRINGPLEKLNPRGKGPIAAAIREAAKTLVPGRPAGIILIHDNADNCRQDPCEVAREVHAANPGLKIHLVPVGIEADDLDKMRCVPLTTGGRIFEAPDAESLAQAITDAVTVAMIDPAGGSKPAADKTPPPAKVEAPSPPPVPAGPGLALSARLSKDAAGRLEAPIRWRVLKGDTVVFEASGPSVMAKLEPGSYVVEAAVGLVAARTQAEVVGQTAVQVQVPLQAAALRVTVKDLKDGPASQTALVTIQRLDAGSDTSRPLWIGTAAEADLVIPAGAYKVSVADSMVSREETVTASAGAVLVKEFITASGRLEITTVAKPDAPPLEGVTVQLFRDDPDAPEGRREIARSTALKPSFLLPAGTYYVSARVGAATVRERIAVGAGDTVKRAITLGLAKLAVTSVTLSKPSAVSAGLRPPLRVKVSRLDGDTAREVDRSSASAPEFMLAPGRYRIEATAGSHNVKAVQDIDLEPNANRKLSMKLDAGMVTLKIAGSSSPDVAWEVTDTKGALVTRTLEPAPRLVLAPGRYQVRAETRDKRGQSTFEAVADGQVQTIEVAVP